MLMSLWTGYWQDWELQHVVVFDGPNRTIRVGANTTTVDIRNDIYSAWKEWMLVRDNAKYLPAMRTIGGDPIGGGVFAGDLYFLINDWTLVLDHNINFVGALFSDDFPSPYTTEAGTNLSTTTISNLVLRTIDEPTSGSSGGLTVVQDAKLDQLVSLNTSQTASLDTIIVSQSLAYNEMVIQSASLSTINTNTSTMLASGSLTSTQATMLLEMYRILGLDPTRPLIVTPTSRDAGAEISQTINKVVDTVTVTRD